MAKLKRTHAREIALHHIFALTYQPFDECALEEQLSPVGLDALAQEDDLYAGTLDPAQVAYIHALVQGVARERDALDAQIEAGAKGWKLRRLSRMTLSILRLALYEIEHMTDVPTGVAINEAVNLAKRYDMEDAPAFINGILGAIVRGQTGETASASEQGDAVPAPSQPTDTNGASTV